MWSLGCVIAELFLGWPLYPGASEYDQVTPNGSSAFDLFFFFFEKDGTSIPIIQTLLSVFGGGGWGWVGCSLNPPDSP